MQFEFVSAGRVLFGSGSTLQVPKLARSFGSRVLVVTGRHNQYSNPVLDLLKRDGNTQILQFVCSHEPDLDFLQSSLNGMKAFAPELVISVGGGSVMDSGKALAALYTNPGEVLDYLEVVGQGIPLTATPLPHIAIPTTSGTGSEVTRNAVIAIPSSNIKVSLRSPLIIPSIAVVDPDLTFGLPPDLTASTGMDALTQVIEPLITRKANPLTDALCLQAIPLAARALPAAFKNPGDMNAREGMSLVSLFGGLALANSGLGVVHGFAAAIGGLYPGIGHGSICAAILPAGFKANRQGCQRSPDFASTYARMEEITNLLRNGQSFHGDDVIKKLTNEIQIKSLGDLGVKNSDFPLIIDLALTSSSMKGNPVALSREELQLILIESF